MAAMLALTEQPRFDMLVLFWLGCAGALQLGQFGTSARERLTTTLTEPGGIVLWVTGAPLLMSMPYWPATRATSLRAPAE